MLEDRINSCPFFAEGEMPKSVVDVKDLSGPSYFDP